MYFFLLLQFLFMKAKRYAAVDSLLYNKVKFVEIERNSIIDLNYLNKQGNQLNYYKIKVNRSFNSRFLAPLHYRQSQASEWLILICQEHGSHISDGTDWSELGVICQKDKLVKW